MLYPVIRDKMFDKFEKLKDKELEEKIKCLDKMTDEEKKKVEEIVNKQIQKSLPVQVALLPKEEAEKTNIAEILIEKHRNGETGKVELFFNDKKATFQSMDKSQYGGVEKEFSDCFGCQEKVWLFARL